MEAANDEEEFADGKTEIDNDKNETYTNIGSDIEDITGVTEDESIYDTTDNEEYHQY